MKNGRSFGFNDTISMSDKQQSPGRLQHNSDGTVTVRADQANADELLGDNHPQTHIMRANFLWQLPHVPAGNGALKALGLVANDWNLAGIWSAATGAPYSAAVSYTRGRGTASNLALTGSPDSSSRAGPAADTGTG